MPLAELQDCMVRLARGDYRPIADEIPLTTEERDWLNSLKSVAGLSVTADIQSWWRLSRLAIAVPLTVELLKRTRQEHLIIDYITNAPVRTLFFAAEAEQFKQFLSEQDKLDLFIKTTAAYECAMKNASLLSAGFSNKKTTLMPSLMEITNRSAPMSAATPLFFDRNPLKIFHALLTAQPLPEFEKEDFFLLVAPQLPNFWKQISAAEYLQVSAQKN